MPAMVSVWRVFRKTIRLTRCAAGKGYTVEAVGHLTSH